MTVENLSCVSPSPLSAVTDFNNGLEASSDSDDEDKLHIVEEDSLQEPEAAAAAAGAKAKTTTTTTTSTVLPQCNGSVNGGETPVRDGSM